jgi:acyl-CoA thioesterase FadM
VFYVTARLQVTYLHPTPMGEPLELRAKLTRVEDRKSWLSCTLAASGQVRAQAEILAIRIYREEGKL